MGITIRSLAVLFSFVAAASAWGTCLKGGPCTVDVAGMRCGDGSQSFIRITERPGADKLLIFLNGGGACWDKKTCQCDSKGNCQGGTAVAGLTRPDPSDFGNWQSGAGWRDASNSNNPVSSGYNVIEVPYCTGDVFAGTRRVNHGSSQRPAHVSHVGYENIRLVLDEAARRFPQPNKLVFMGCSAGGIGVTVNTKQLVAAFPKVPAYVISDSGLPFKVPHVNSTALAKILRTWGVEQNFTDVDPGVDKVLDLADLVAHNGKHYDHVRYAFFSSYGDAVMTSFSGLLRSPYPGKAVERTMIDLADHDLTEGRQAVFYLDGTKHCFTGKAPDTIFSEGVSLAEFSRKMVDDEGTWESVRPR